MKGKVSFIRKQTNTLQKRLNGDKPVKLLIGEKVDLTAKNSLNTARN